MTVRGLPIIGVMGSGKETHLNWSHPLGELIASKPAHLLTGGGQGTMSAVGHAFTSATDRQGFHLAFIPTENGQAKAGYPNDYVEIPLLTPLGVFTGENPEQISRNHANVMTSAIIIALPGSKGTKNEVSIAVELGKPILLFGPEDAFSDFTKTPERTTEITRVSHFIDQHLRLG